MTPLLRRAALAALLLLPLIACSPEQKAAVLPAPQEPSAASVSHFCSMAVLDHTGPKGQVFLKGAAAPLWFASVRDTIAFTMLPEEPKDAVAIYVNDMTGARDFEHPAAGHWVEARKAWYVSGSDFHGGMGGTEPVPFAEKAAAQHFAAIHGGRLVRFAGISEAEILGGDETAAAGAPPTPQR